MRTRTLGYLISAALLGGCYADATYGAGVTVSASTPDLVAVEPGVSVIADYDYPVFYADGLYWRFQDGYWYRSNAYTGGWVYADRPPRSIARIRSPHAYTHYRPYGYVAHHRPMPQRERVVRRGSRMRRY